MAKCKTRYAVCIQAAGDDEVHYQKMSGLARALKAMAGLSEGSSDYAFIQQFILLDRSTFKAVRKAIGRIGVYGKRAEVRILTRHDD